ncbi:concanavalin [Leptospira ognonensis]|uniref:Concanavalin n=1 Tax=Leptospira ognonensis TaxID=2484945 RepID=A0A4R9JW47_9LEPT|nr:LamG-like jellyroll fold domain-containing protein [Leptospira ognonensis]TGL56244.1 concanavalin [Leptospira ognonensis]
MKYFSYILLSLLALSCSVPSLSRNPIEFLSIFRIFTRSPATTASTETVGEFTLGGAVSGLLSNTSVTLSNGSDSTTVSADGNFTFSTKVKTGSTYNVTFSTPDSAKMICTLANASGTMQTSNIANVSLTCGWESGYYEVGVSVSGTTSTLAVQNNGTDSTSISSLGLTKFNSRIKTGSNYAVTITSQTPGVLCSFVNPKLSVGTMPMANVTVFVKCLPGYLKGGTVHSVASADLFPDPSASNMFVNSLVGSYPTNVPGGGGPIFGTADGTSSATRFNNPKGMASDGSYVYVADYANDLIRKIDKTNGTTTTFAGGATGGGSVCPGTTTTNCLDGTGTAAQFYRPFALTTDGTSLYVLEFLGNRIRRIDLATAEVTTLAGNGNNAPFADNSDGMLASFNNPHGIVLFNGMLYVSDRYNHRIRTVNPVTGAVSTLAGSGVAGFADLNGTSAQFDNPIGIVGVGSYLYVTDGANHRIRRIDPTGSISVTTIAGQGIAASTDGFGTNAQFSSPFALTTDGTNLILSDYGTYKIRHVRLSDAKVTTLAGGTVGYADNAGGNALMERAAYVSSDGVNIYITEEANHALRRLENAEITRYTLDGNANDSVGTNHGSLIGTPTATSDENGTTNGAYEFNGTSQYVQSVIPSSMVSPVRDSTISAWIFNAGTATNGIIFYNGSFGSDGYGLIINSNSQLYIRYNNVNVSGAVPVLIPFNTWTHVAMIVRNGNSEVYVNGVNKLTFATTLTVGPTGSFLIAGDGTAANSFKGKVSDVRFFNGALDGKAIEKLAIQVPSGIISYFPLNGNAIDWSGNENNATSVTAGPTNDRFGNISSAMAFASDFIERTSPNRMPMGNAPRSYCAWVRPTAAGAMSIVNFGTLAAGTLSGLTIDNSTIINDGNTPNLSVPHFNLLNLWTHICGTYDGTNASVYYNGILQSSSAISWTTGTSTLLRIGMKLDGSQAMTGMLDDVRIYNRVLTSSEITALSGHHPLQISGLQLHLQADSINTSPFATWVDNSPNNNTGFFGGNTVVQGNPPSRPSWMMNGLNNKPSVIFSGSQYLENTSGTYPGLSTDSFTFFIVNSRAATANIQVALQIGPILGGKKFYFDDPGGTQTGFGSVFALDRSNSFVCSRSSTGFSGLATARIFSFYFDNTSSIASPFFWDTTGAEGTTLSTGTFAVPFAGMNNGTVVGAGPGPGPGADFYNGKISEILYFDRVLSTSEGNKVRCYLSSKYNIAVGNVCP